MGVLSASHLNAYGRLHWRALGSTQNYFDQTGVFVSFLWSAPLALMSFGILIHSVWSASNLLIAVKRHQLGVDTRPATAKPKPKPNDAAPTATVEPLDQEVRNATSTAPTSGVKQRKSKAKN